MTGGPGVSVVIVNHTRREELALTLKALEYQRYRRFEVVVVSDMDAAARPASPLGVRWVRFEERNISAARNLGIAAARGEVIAFIDDDAQPEFCWLEALVAAFDMPEVGAAGGWVRGRNGVSWQWRTVEVDAEGWDHPVESGEGMKVFAPRADRWVKTVGTNAAFRRVALAQAGGFDEAYRFFLDEVDLNRRVAEAGWSTAIVPRAEVLHGYAAGPHRTSRRVPRDLFEIGASQAAFVARTGTGEAVAREQTREQEHRLGRLFDLGLLSGRRRTWLLDRYRAGRTEGAAREVAIPPVAAAAAAKLSGQPTQDTREPVVLTVRLGRVGEKFAQAERLAGEGAEVTVLQEALPWRPLAVRFTPHGYFLHRFGAWGLMERTRPRPAPGFRRRAGMEIDRLRPTRCDLREL